MRTPPPMNPISTSFPDISKPGPNPATRPATNAEAAPPTTVGTPGSLAGELLTSTVYPPKAMERITESVIPRVSPLSSPPPTITTTPMRDMNMAMPVSRVRDSFKKSRAKRAA